MWCLQYTITIRGFPHDDTLKKEEELDLESHDRGNYHQAMMAAWKLLKKWEREEPSPKPQNPFLAWKEPINL